MQGLSRADTKSLKAAKVVTEDDLSYFEKLARPKKRENKDEFLFADDAKNCVFKPERRKTKMDPSNTFEERLKGYINTHKKVRSLEKADDPECTFMPQIRLGQYKDNVEGAGKAIDRIIAKGKQYAARKNALASEKGGTFEPDLSLSKKSYKANKRGTVEEKTFKERTAEDFKARQERQKTRERMADPKASGATFTPRINKESRTVAHRRGSFMERMQDDVQMRETRHNYRAKLFGLVTPAQRKAGGTERPGPAQRARPATAPAARASHVNKLNVVEDDDVRKRAKALYFQDHKFKAYVDDNIIDVEVVEGFLAST